MNEDLSSTEFIVGFADPKREVMIVSIPIGRLAGDILNGTSLLRGKLEEAKHIALAEIQHARAKRESVGLIKPNGSKPDLNVV